MTNKFCKNWNTLTQKLKKTKTENKQKRRHGNKNKIKAQIIILQKERGGLSY